MPRPPSAMASPGASPFGSTSVPPACEMRAFSRLAPTPSSSATAGTLSDSCKRAARRHRALERQIEILRRIGAVAHRAILDQRFRMRDAVLEGEPVDEGLQRRAGRAQRIGHVDLAGAALVEIIGRRDAGQHLAGGVVDRDDRDREIGAERARPLARQVLEILLQAGVDGQPMDLLLRQRRDRLIGGMRRQRRHRPPAGRQRLSSLAQRDLVGRNLSRPWRCGRARGRAPPARRWPSGPAGAASGDCGSATSSAASASESFFGSLPK